MVNAGLALQFSDQIEAVLGLAPTKQEEQRLKEHIPRVSLIEKDDAK